VVSTRPGRRDTAFKGGRVRGAWDSPPSIVVPKKGEMLQGGARRSITGKGRTEENRLLKKRGFRECLNRESGVPRCKRRQKGNSQVSLTEEKVRSSRPKG